MKLVTPDFGLVIWMSLTFLTVLFLLSKFAWKPILKMIKDREESIEGALQSAEKAKQEMVRLQSNNESLLREAQLEREAMLKAARDAKDAMINDAKATAKATASGRRAGSWAATVLRSYEILRSYDVPRYYEIPPPPQIVCLELLMSDGTTKLYAHLSQNIWVEQGVVGGYISLSSTEG
jgi:hypothetical protein